MPTMDELVELAECAADRVTLVRDNHGVVLLDRRDRVTADLIAQGLMEPDDGPLSSPC